jgi:integrase
MANRSTFGKLAALAVKQAKPRDKQYKLSDGGGLYLLVKPDNARYWRLKYRSGGIEKTYSIGVYPQVSLADAREKAGKAKKLVEQGIDPTKERKARRKMTAGNTFAAVAREWWGKKRGSCIPDDAARVWKSLDDSAIPAIGNTPIDKVTAQDVLAVLRQIEERGSLDVASRVQQRIRSVLDYAVYTGRAASNPVSSLRDVLQTRRVTHRKALDRRELPKFLGLLETTDRLRKTTQLALRLLVLTFVRPGELRRARWDEFDLEARQWRIPADRMKMRQEHIVPLSDQAIALLKELCPLTGHFDLVFPGDHDWRKPMSENTLTYAIRKRLKFDATAHGFRAVASTALNEQGWRPDVIERQLAHAERNKVRAAYHRSQYLEERHKMMQAWADYLDRLTSGADVTPILRTA